VALESAFMGDKESKAVGAGQFATKVVIDSRPYCFIRALFIWVNRFLKRCDIYQEGKC